MCFKKTCLLGSIVLIGMILSACSSALPAKLDYHFSRELTLDVDEINDQFISTGVGTAQLISCEDGDTAEFLTEGSVVRVRFIGVDTPEASHFYEPWGYEATVYACELLSQSNSIVLEADPNLTRTDNYGRHLAYIWVDGTLLNLRLIEQAYSPSVGAGNLKYASLFQQASDHAQSLNERVWSSSHPTFSTQRRGDGLDVSLHVLWSQPEEYSFKRVNVEGVITRILGDQAFLQSGSYGIYLYAGHGRGANDRLAQGHSVRLNDVQFFVDEQRFYGPFLTDINNQSLPSKIGSVNVLETGVIIEPQKITLDTLDTQPSHTLITIETLTLTHFETLLSSRNFPTERWSAEDDAGNSIIIEQSDRVYEALRTDIMSLQSQQKVTITGILIRANGETKILLTQPSDLILLTE